MSLKKGSLSRKQFSFVEGVPTLESMTITEKPLKGEDEEQFAQRLVRQYGRQNGEFEIVIKSGRPDYAIITLSPDKPTSKSSDR
jgi:hypothetical protein